MRTYRRLCVHLSKRDRKELRQLLRKGFQPVRTILRALTLLQLDAGQTAGEVATHLQLSSKAVREIGRRYEQEGIERALHDKQRPGAAALLDAGQKQRIIAMVCSDPPAGRARWTVRLIAAEAVRRKLVPRAGRETIRLLLESHDFQPWRKKMWCVAELDELYIERMEDVLALYEKPYDAAEPVVCLDEKPISLQAEVRPPRRAAPGHIAKQDNEYQRRGTANVFAVVEPKAGRHFTCATPNRTAAEFAKTLGSLLENYRSARTIHVVWDNLNIHCKKSLTDHYGKEQADEMWSRLTIHATPIHGSWLHQAEMELSLYSRQCLGTRRIPDLKTLQRETRSWKARVNRDQVKINWKFERTAARKNFGYNKNSFRQSIA